MALQSFKDLLAWQKARYLSLNIYKDFAVCKDWGFRDQIQRASISIMNNIAEGYGRRGDKALASFLVIARGSAAETESMIMMAHQLQYISPKTQAQLLGQIEEVAKLLTAFINKLNTDTEIIIKNKLSVNS